MVWSSKRPGLFKKKKNVFENNFKKNIFNSQCVHCFCEIPSKSQKGKACNMLEPTFMGMASNNSSCSQNFEKWAWRVFLFLFYFFSFPIRAEIGRYGPKQTDTGRNGPKYVLKKKVKKFGKTHRFEAYLKKKTLRPYLKLSVSLVLSFSVSPLSLSLSNPRLSHSLTQIPFISLLAHWPSSLFISRSQSRSQAHWPKLTGGRAKVFFFHSHPPLYSHMLYCSFFFF